MKLNIAKRRNVIIITKVYIRGIVLVIILVIFAYTFISSISNLSNKQDDISIAINADNETKVVINKALNKIDKNIVKHISSITISDEELRSVCMIKFDRKIYGCAVPSIKDDDFIVDIYLTELYNYDTSHTFNYTLYHEIGHVDYWITFGVCEPPKIFMGTEIWANEYADKYVFNSCNDYQIHTFRMHAIPIMKS